MKVKYTIAVRLLCLISLLTINFGSAEGFKTTTPPSEFQTGSENKKSEPPVYNSARKIENSKLHDIAFLGKKRIYFNKSALPVFFFTSNFENSITSNLSYSLSSKHSNSEKSADSIRSPPITN